MKLKELFRNVPVLAFCADPDAEVTAVTCDSRNVTKGSLFVAVSGYAADGNRFCMDAIRSGALAVVTATRPKESIPYILVGSDRSAMAAIGCNFYGDPSAAMTLVGITGTNGKTTSTVLLKHILEKTQGAKVGLIGTMENRIGELALPAERTTPDSLELQGLLAKMRDAGCKYVVMEVSSHAIALERIAGIRYRVAAFTNLTEDHLDFHRTMEHYCDTKARLFASSDRQVANEDDPWFQRICAGASDLLTTSAISSKGLYAKDIRLHADGICFTAVRKDICAKVKLPIPGRFTVYNALTALGCALQLGIPLEAAAESLKTAKGVKGRVEVVPTPGKPYTVLIDYAHTPDGLENVLRSVRDYCRGRLICVFGCGGDRDPVKRPIMGRIGVALSDVAILTSDNPRTEDPMAILADIQKGADMAGKSYLVIEKRADAIRHAMDIGEKCDIIILAGKGHETYQEIGGVKYPLDERAVIADYLKETRR